MSKLTGLGQGVNLLFGNETEDEKYFVCEISKIDPNKYQPRTTFDEGELLELADSIRSNGVIQPLVVTPSDKNGAYTLIAGERRLRASKLAGLTSVPVIVRDLENEDSLLELAIIENVQRTDLNPIEEAEAYNRLIEKFGYTQEETARKVGKNRSTITNMLRLLNLPEFIKQDIISGVLSEGHARSLLRLAGNNSSQKEIRDLIVKNKLSVRQVEKLIRKLNATPKMQTATVESDQIPASYLAVLANQLTNTLNSNVKISQTGGRGKIEIEYYSLDDLERLVGTIANQPPCGIAEND
ncbi:MAG: ParB/RepB/Spo0J family partition protein [Desulfocapsaceae bacterium]|nr:ParB/RepB/Spo0J family partition protein [Desulfocapsaceae bacterium]